MREILFKGQRTNNKEWVYGDYQLYSLQHLIIKRGKQEKYKVIPKTVGQYTEYEDKNKTKIFEDDIVLWGDKIYKVAKCCGCWVIYNNTYRRNYKKWKFLDAIADKIEVIGNIHDNPELLEE